MIFQIFKVYQSLVLYHNTRWKFQFHTADNNATRDEQSLYANCIQKAEFMLFMLLSSCMYKTEMKILIAATHLI